MSAAPDVRTAAQEAAVTRAYNKITGQDGPWGPDVTMSALRELWGAALVTPTREQIAREIYKTCWGDMLTWADDNEQFYAYADAVLALLERGEDACGSPGED